MKSHIVTKSPRKAIATRSRLENKYYKNKNEDIKSAYKKHRNYCNRLYKKERKMFYENLDKKLLLITNCFGKL